ncbi:MAG: hypothetical protein A2719_05420 [Candidatus Ryanbacteria bacterium RIFCSPHIGHO2_01_FULL_45_22]|uniref:Uncharacterized protein n=2 Tax=Candidatus Ryaniibacteriota TaxID=1817914 RepID=A0A1G2G0F0_9BACT|nr:MAG: hypothetical protein A2719_05420 [Candidatus Ryanbacteria bacterium RIFCSPHIGHO2_01_FULL_45_22]OGZ45393.1 MAG: hypothetical protein A3J54_00895 [Candidatus Ryanbacteria bacterium RIFCSPHIGHO2_02_FULL_45_13b]
MKRKTRVVEMLSQTLISNNVIPMLIIIPAEGGRTDVDYYWTEARRLAEFLRTHFCQTTIGELVRALNEPFDA